MLPRLRLSWPVLFCLALFALVAVGWAADRFATDRALAAERARLGEVAALAGSNYRRQVDTFQLVATALSDEPGVRRVLEPGGAAELPALNRRLAGLNARLDSSVIYLIDRTGLTVASSNYDRPDAFTGQNYGFRDYFRGAMRTGEHSQFALGTRSRIPGLFVARRVGPAAAPLGVLVVKIRFDRLEREWRTSIGEAFVANRDGIILVTSDPALRFRTLRPIPPADRPALLAGQEYGGAALDQHPRIAAGRVLGPGPAPWRGERDLAVGRPLANGETLVVVDRLAPAIRAARNGAFLAVLLSSLALLGAAGIVLARRRAAQAALARERQQQRDQLRGKLDQAHRLSSLGQIAAGVGHEINQPLAAIGIRADSAARLIAAGRTDEAVAALGEIDALVGRAGAITGELRRFARRAERTNAPFPLALALDGLRLLTGDRLARDGAALEVALDDPEVLVIGEQARLEQVLVNLVQNALDAGARTIRIDAATAAEAVLLTVADDGPGLAPAIRADLFQPFSTSKENGLGLGLVISRDIVAGFGGELEALDNSPGASFRIRLLRG